MVFHADRTRRLYNMGCLYTHTHSLCGWVWVGDFNFKPSSITVERDPAKTREKAWSSTMKGLSSLAGKPRLLDPERIDDSTPPANGKQRFSTQCDGDRGIDPGVASASLAERASLFIHNGIHCQENNFCTDAACLELCGLDHWGL